MHENARRVMAGAGLADEWRFGADCAAMKMLALMVLLALSPAAAWSAPLTLICERATLSAYEFSPDPMEVASFTVQIDGDVADVDAEVAPGGRYQSTVEQSRFSLRRPRAAGAINRVDGSLNLLVMFEKAPSKVEYWLKASCRPGKTIF